MEISATEICREENGEMDPFNKFLQDNPEVDKVLRLLFTIIVVSIIVFIIFRVHRRLINKVHKLRKGKENLNTRMIENIFRFIVIFIAVQFVMMSSDLTRNFGQTLFQGTAVLAAIAGFAAQNTLSDILCGFMISTTKPFEIGDRIELVDNGVSGIVKDLTLRHVVLQSIDTQMYVIPNSKMNSQQIKNLSWHTDKRSVDFKFQVSYDADPDQARAVIRQAVMDSPISVPGKTGQDGNGEYADVYFLSFEEYSLVMGTTAYYLPGTPTEVFKTDINTRVKKALEANGIEIPYKYINVQMKTAAKG